MIIILGSTGYVGSAFRARLDRLEIPYLALSRDICDYTDVDVLTSVIIESNATFLINAAGYTGKPNVDACEENKAMCLLGNAVLPGIINESCELAKIPWAHISSGCIYTGQRENGAGFSEKDTPNFCFRENNCSWYSGTKALGEECLENSETTYIWRLRIPFNHIDSDRNYLSKIMRYDRLLNAENSISHLNEFVSACIDCWQLKAPFGIYNITNTGSITTKRITELIVEHYDSCRQFRFFTDEAQFLEQAALTPRSNCVLDNSKILEIGVNISNVEDALVKSLQGWVPE